MTEIDPNAPIFIYLLAAAGWAIPGLVVAFKIAMRLRSSASEKELKNDRD